MKECKIRWGTVVFFLSIISSACTDQGVNSAFSGGGSKEVACLACPSGTACFQGACRQTCIVSADCGLCGLCQSGFCQNTGSFCVTGITPLDGQQNVSPTLAAVNVDFSENLVEESLVGNVFVKKGQFMLATDNHCLGSKLIIRFEDSLEANTEYTIQLTDKIQSTESNFLKTPFSALFKTAKTATDLDEEKKPEQQAAEGDYHRYGLEVIAGRVSGDGITVDVFGHDFNGRLANENININVGSK